MKLRRDCKELQKNSIGVDGLLGDSQIQAGAMRMETGKKRQEWGTYEH